MQTLLRTIYDLTYRFGKPGWDTGVPPSELVALVESAVAKGRALDLGCGTGTNAIFLAQQGFETLGIDFSAKAIKSAWEKARSVKAQVAFQVGDVTRLSFLREPFDLVLDVGCFHGLDDAGRMRYARHLVRLTRLGSRYLLWAFDPGSHRGIGVAPGEIEQRFGGQFKMIRIEHGNGHAGRDATWYWLVRTNYQKPITIYP